MAILFVQFFWSVVAGAFSIGSRCSDLLQVGARDAKWPIHYCVKVKPLSYQKLCCFGLG